MSRERELDVKRRSALPKKLKERDGHKPSRYAEKRAEALARGAALPARRSGGDETALQGAMNAALAKHERPRGRKAVSDGFASA